MRTRWEAGFTLIEAVIVVAIIALVAGAAGTFFLAGATPAVAAANRDIVAVLNEGRRAAIAFDRATVVFAPASSGTGYSARVYARIPGDDGFRVSNGPAYESTVAITETAAPLGAPGFALTIDHRGTVAALAHYVPGGSDYVETACPASGAFRLHLAYVHDVRDIAVPCRVDLSDVPPVAGLTPLPAVTVTPVPASTCPATESCTIAVLQPGTPTCPPDTTGTFPNCFVLEPTPTPAAPQIPASPPATPVPAMPTPPVIIDPTAPPGGLGGGQTSSTAAGICTISGAVDAGALYDCTLSGGDAAQFFVLSAPQSIGIDATGNLLDANGASVYLEGSTGYVFSVWKVGQSGYLYRATSTTDPNYVAGQSWETFVRLDLGPGTYGYEMSATCDTGFLAADPYWCGAPVRGGRPIVDPYSGSWQANYELR